MSALKLNRSDWKELFNKAVSEISSHDVSVTWQESEADNFQWSITIDTVLSLSHFCISWIDAEKNEDKTLKALTSVVDRIKKEAEKDFFYMSLIKTGQTTINPLGTLKDLKLTKLEFAEIMGVSANTVTNWGNNFPQYARQWLQLQVNANYKLNAQDERLNSIIDEEKRKHITEFQYRENVDAIAQYIWDEALTRYEDENDEKPMDANQVFEFVNDEGMLSEFVDNDEWMIYTRYHGAICEHASNPEAYEDFGLELKGDWSNIQKMVAYCALEFDVRECLYAFDLEEEEEE
ncbi:hypothetical protein VPHD63_0053 [Vibrio phage D63]